MTTTSPAIHASDPSSWLALAAAPTFALMGALMGLAAGNGMPPMCGGPGFLPIDGMTAMYLLMSLFHLPPWLKLASRSRARR